MSVVIFSPYALYIWFCRSKSTCPFWKLAHFSRAGGSFVRMLTNNNQSDLIWSFVWLVRWCHLFSFSSARETHFSHTQSLIHRWKILAETSQSLAVQASLYQNRDIDVHERATVGSQLRTATANKCPKKNLHRWKFIFGLWQNVEREHGTGDHCTFKWQSLLSYCIRACVIPVSSKIWL